MFFVIVIISITNYSYNGIATRASGTPLYEYRIIFFIAGMIHSRNSKTGKYFWTITVLLSSGISMVGGNRSDAIPIIIAYVYFYFDDVAPKKILPMIFSAIFLMISLGMYRQTLLYGRFDFAHLWEKVNSEKLTFDTAYWAYPPSLASIAISNVDGLIEKLKLLGYHILYIVEGGKYRDFLFTVYTRTPGYARVIYDNLGGYVSLTYFYYWIGLLSPVLFGAIVYAYIKLYNRIKYSQVKSMIRRDLYKGVSAYFVATVPRWFLYNPFSLIRGEAIMVIGVILTSAVSSAMLNKKFN